MEQEKPKPQKFRCSNCNSAQTYLTNKGRRCRKCGFLDETAKPKSQEE